MVSEKAALAPDPRELAISEAQRQNGASLGSQPPPPAAVAEFRPIWKGTSGRRATMGLERTLSTPPAGPAGKSEHGQEETDTTQILGKQKRWPATVGKVRVSEGPRRGFRLHSLSFCILSWA